jgi:uncharacterized LabA/DUF88 family protein
VGWYIIVTNPPCESARSLQGLFVSYRHLTMTAHKAILLIDGSNFYYKLKEAGFKNLLDFDFAKLAAFLSHGNTLVKKNYYIGRVRQDGTEKSDKLVASQQSLFARLRRAGFRYTLGYLLKSGGAYHEKGVDVQIAVDMVVAAYEKNCKRVILASSDTDLAPAIAKAKQKGLIIEYVGFSFKPSVAMVSFCNESRLLTKEELSTLFTKTARTKRITKQRVQRKQPTIRKTPLKLNNYKQNKPKR